MIVLGIDAPFSRANFARAVRMPYAVLAGMPRQFTVVPLLRWSITLSFGLPAGRRSRGR